VRTKQRDIKCINHLAIHDRETFSWDVDYFFECTTLAFHRDRFVIGGIHKNGSGG
jgi:hypothetical protein